MDILKTMMFLLHLLIMLICNSAKIRVQERVYDLSEGCAKYRDSAENY